MEQETWCQPTKLQYWSVQDIGKPGIIASHYSLLDVPCNAVTDIQYGTVGAYQSNNEWKES